MVSDGSGCVRRGDILARSCPLRPLDAFRTFEQEELAFVSSFKKGELGVDKGATVLVEGSHSAHLYTVLFGLGFRYKLLADGRRQILNYLLPGDLIGLQGSLMGEMQHSVEALSPMLLCVFEREQLHDALPKSSRALPSTSPGSPRARSRCSTRTCSASAGARRSSAPPI